MITKHKFFKDIRALIYFDIQKVGGVLNPSAVTLSCISSTGRKFYAEFSDFDADLCTSNDIRKIIKYLRHPNTILEGDNWSIVGTIESVAKQFVFWLGELMQSFNVPDNGLFALQFATHRSHEKFPLLLSILSQVRSALVVNNVCLELAQEIALSMSSLNTIDGVFGACSFQVAATDDIVKQISDYVMEQEEKEDRSIIYMKDVADKYPDNIFMMNAARYRLINEHFWDIPFNND